MATAIDGPVTLRENRTDGIFLPTAIRRPFSASLDHHPATMARDL